MPFIEGIGDEVTQFFICVFIVVVAYVAWISTYTSDEAARYRTILLLNHRRRIEALAAAGGGGGGRNVRSGSGRSLVRVRIPTRTLSHVTESITISESSTDLPNTATIDEPLFSTDATNNQSDNANMPTSSAQLIRNESRMNPNIQHQDLSSTAAEDNSKGSSSEGKDETQETEPTEETLELNNSSHTNQLEDVEKSTIIDSMDEQNLVRRSRIARFATAANAAGCESDSYNNVATTAATYSNATSPGTEQKAANETNSTPHENNSDKSKIIKIKLKYINDDVRIVEGHLEHMLGDFKSKHFESELKADKIVRLIFNGQVLTDNRKTLKQCGLYNNCVVHCLIHPKRLANDASDSISQGNGQNRSNNNQFDTNFLNNNNNQEVVEWDLGILLVIMITGALVAAWYFKFSQPQFYSVSATAGLVIITGIFSIAVISAYLHRNDDSPDDDMVGMDSMNDTTAAVLQSEGIHL